jgi:hypothetical protein
LSWEEKKTILQIKKQNKENMHEKSKRGFAKEKKRGFSSRQENPI